MRELQFDLSPLKREFQEAYQTESGIIILQLLDLDGAEDSIPVTYEF